MNKCIVVIILFFNSFAFAYAGSNFITSDSEITRRVRQQILQDPSLSPYARSLKIITIDGQVLIRGVVFNADEANRVLDKVQSVSGVLEIVTELHSLNE
jgi:osmotically-inducible protein OsmY